MINYMITVLALDGNNDYAVHMWLSHTILCTIRSDSEV
jgi:hypothetical protein